MTATSSSTSSAATTDDTQSGTTSTASSSSTTSAAETSTEPATTSTSTATETTSDAISSTTTNVATFPVTSSALTAMPTYAPSSLKAKCKARIMIVLDNSASIGQANFDTALVGLEAMARSTILLDTTEIAVVGFGYGAWVEFDWKPRTDAAKAISKIVYPKGRETHTGAGIDVAKTLFPAQRNGQELWLMAVVTDGQATVPSRLKVAAKNIPNHIIPFAIGMGDPNRIDQNELLLIAQEKQDNTLLMSFGGFASNMDTVLERMCGEPLEVVNVSSPDLEDCGDCIEATDLAEQETRTIVLVIPCETPEKAIELTLETVEGCVEGFISNKMPRPNDACFDVYLSCEENGKSIKAYYPLEGIDINNCYPKNPETAILNNPVNATPCPSSSSRKRASPPQQRNAEVYVTFVGRRSGSNSAKLYLGRRKSKKDSWFAMSNPGFVLSMIVAPCLIISGTVIAVVVVILYRKICNNNSSVKTEPTDGDHNEASTEPVGEQQHSVVNVNSSSDTSSTTPQFGKSSSKSGKPAWNWDTRVKAGHEQFHRLGKRSQSR